jgi:hypothetical protein
MRRIVSHARARTSPSIRASTTRRRSASQGPMHHPTSGAPAACAARGGVASGCTVGLHARVDGGCARQRAALRAYLWGCGCASVLFDRSDLRETHCTDAASYLHLSTTTATARPQRAAQGQGQGQGEGDGGSSSSGGGCSGGWGAERAGESARVALGTPRSVRMCEQLICFCGCLRLPQNTSRRTHPHAQEVDRRGSSGGTVASGEHSGHHGVCSACHRRAHSPLPP